MIWNPSEGIHIGPIYLRFYSLMFVLAFATGWYIMKRIFTVEKLTYDKLDSLFIWIVLSTLLGARLGHVFFYDWEYFRNHLGEILLPFKFEPEFEFTGFAGLASHGAAIAILISMYFYSYKIVKRPYLWVLDRIVIPVASGAVFVRIGNFFNSEILGKETTSKYGVRFIRDTISPNEASYRTGISDTNLAYDAIINNPKHAQLLATVPMKHPVQLYEAISYVFIFIILVLLYTKTRVKDRHGFIFGVFMLLLWSVRFVIEELKESQGGIESFFGLFSTGQWLSFPFIIAGIGLVIMAEKPIPRFIK
jgi:prolipoprotein diacylglyceryl transferase